MSEWVQGKYTTERRELDGGFSLSVTWVGGRGNEAPYEASFDGRKLKGGFVDRASAQAAAERVARRLLERALADLNRALPAPPESTREP